MITKTAIESKLVEFAKQVSFSPDAPSMSKDLYYGMIAGVLVQIAGLPRESVQSAIVVLQALPKNESAMRQKLVSLMSEDKPASPLGASLMDAFMDAPTPPVEKPAKG